MKDSYFRSFKDIKSAIGFFKNNRFVCTKVIVSGKLYIDFIKQNEDNIAHLYTIPEIVIFTGHKEYFIKANKKYQHIIRNPLYNYGGIQTDFEKIKSLIK